MERPLNNRALPATYTRGWELLSHWITMLRASAQRHLVVSIAVGVFGATLCLCLGVETEVLMRLGQLGVAEAWAYLAPSRSVQGGHSAAVAYQLLLAEVGGRSASYFFRQWAVLFFIWFMAGGLGFLWVVTAYGQAVLRGRNRRGVILKKIEDPTTQATKDRLEHLIRAIGLAALVGLAVCALVIVAGPLAGFPEYLRAFLVAKWAPAAHVLAVNPEHRLVWVSQGARPGLYRAEQIYEALRLHHFRGIGALGWMVRLGLLDMVAGLAALFVFERRLQKRGPQLGDGGYQVAGYRLEPGKETMHIALWGSTGSGKSTLMRDLLDQHRALGRRCIVYDRTGEWTELYYRKGRDKILNPLDARSEIWTPWADAEKESDYLTMAASLFPIGESKDPFWVLAAQELFADTLAVLAVAEKVEMVTSDGSAEDPEEIRATVRWLLELLIRRPISQLAKVLQKIDAPSAQYFQSSRPDMPLSVKATCTGKLRAWASLPELPPGQAPFSIKRFLLDDSTDGWLFLSSREDQAAIQKPLISLWVDIASATLLSRPKSITPRAEWFVALDELGSLQALPSLEPLLTRGRGHGVASILGLQNVSQLRHVYGKDQATTLAAQPGTWVVLRSTEPETAQYLSSALGEMEVDEAKSSVSYGANSQRDGVSISQQTTTKKVALPSEIMALADRTGYLRTPGGREIYEISYGVKQRKKLADAFVERTSKRRGPSQVINVFEE